MLGQRLSIPRGAHRNSHGQGKGREESHAPLQSVPTEPSRRVKTYEKLFRCFHSLRSLQILKIFSSELDPSSTPNTQVVAPVRGFEFGPRGALKHAILWAEKMAVFDLLRKRGLTPPSFFAEQKNSPQNIFPYGAKIVIDTVGEWCHNNIVTHPLPERDTT